MSFNHTSSTSTPEEFSSSQKASVYSPSRPFTYFSKSSIITVLLLFESITFLLFPNLLYSPIAWLLIGISIPLLVRLVFRKIMLTIILRTPTKENYPLSDSKWEEIGFVGWGGDNLVGHHLVYKENNPDLLLYIHGYGSSLASGESRALHLAQQGMDVVSMDLRGHGNCALRNDWTPLKVTADIEALLDVVVKKYSTPPKNFWIYGHSVGGYIALRLASYPSSWWSKIIAGVMLESPATSFPYIVEDNIPKFMSSFMPWVRQLLRKEYERIHPDLNVRYANAQIPHMGLPKEIPILVLQAANDDRLGRKHFDLLMRYKDEINCDAFLLSEHAHTSRLDSEQRRNHLQKWLKSKRLNYIEGLV